MFNFFLSLFVGIILAAGVDLTIRYLRKRQAAQTAATVAPSPLSAVENTVKTEVAKVESAAANTVQVAEADVKVAEQKLVDSTRQVAAEVKAAL